MTVRRQAESHVLFLIFIGLLTWVVPGGGYFLLNEKKRGIIIFITIVLTFCMGLYIGSIGVIDMVGTTAIYVKLTQAMNPLRLRQLQGIYLR